MKQVMIPLLSLMLTTTAASAQQQMKDVATMQPITAGKLHFKTVEHDFGTLDEGPTASFDFQYTNNGSMPVTISNAKAGCGCTVAAWSHEPILPGKTGSIHVTYNTDRRPGPFTKQVTVTTDASTASTILTIKGSVTAKTPVTVAAQ